MSKQVPKKLSVKYSHGEFIKHILLQKLLLFLGTKLPFRIAPGKKSFNQRSAVYNFAKTVFQNVSKMC